MTDEAMVTQPPLDREAELDLLEAHVQTALRQAEQMGASEAEVSAHTSQGLSVTVRMGDVETLEHMQDRGISVTVLVGRAKGQASSADLRPSSIQSCVQHAMDIARFTQEDPCNGLADPALLATGNPDLDLWHPAPVDAQAAVVRALACEDAGRSDDRISNSEGAAFNAGLGLSVYGNSNGFIGRTGGTHFSQSCILLAGEGERMQRDYSYDSRRCMADLERVEETGREAARRTIARLDARQLPTGEMPVLFAPQVASGIMSHLIGAISGSALIRNASFLKDRVGERLFPEWMRLAERPRLLRGANSAHFDSDGVATRERNIIERGVLTGYALSAYTARRLELETTANAGGVRNLLLPAGGEGEGDLLATMGEGFLVTEVMGQGINLVTGDYSRGAAGFFVRNGKVDYPVEEVTIAGNLNDMFQNVIATGEDIDTRGNVHSGSLLLASMMVAGS